MRIVKCLSFLLCAWSISGLSNSKIVFTEPDSLFIIDSIRIIGNEKTDADIITNELSFIAGDSITAAELPYNEERVYSLGIFNKVQIRRANDSSRVVVVKIEEAWYWWPLPYLDFRDRDLKKISYGIDFMVKNFRGRNETIRFKTFFGYDPGYAFQYTIPNLSARYKIFGEAALSYLNQKNKSEIARSLYGDDFKQKYLSARVTLGKRLNLYQWVFLTTQYEKVDYPQSPINPAFPKRSRDEILSARIQFLHDSRNLAQFASNGMYLQLAAEAKGIGNSLYQYQILSADCRQYLPLSERFNFKWRYMARQVNGDTLPFFDKSYFGFMERIRGHFNEQEEGNSMYLLTTELHYALFPDFPITLSYLPLIPKELEELRGGLYYHIFLDYGGLKKRGEPISLHNFKLGFGGGFSFLVLPHRVFRFEMGFNEKFHPEYIFDLDVSF